MNHRFSATQNRRASLLLSAHLPPKKLKIWTEQEAQKLDPQCVSYRPLKTESSCLQGKRSGGRAGYPLPPPPQGHSLCLCLGLCPGSLASVNCIPGPLVTCAHPMGSLARDGDGKRDGRVFLPILSYSPCPGPSPVAPAPWLCGSICSLDPAGPAGRGLGEGDRCLLRPPRSWLSPFHVSIPWTPPPNWSPSFARTLKRHQGMETVA